MEQWLNLFIKITKPVITTIAYTGINSWLDAFQEEIKERKKQQARQVLNVLTTNSNRSSQQVDSVFSPSQQVTKQAEKNQGIFAESAFWPLRLSPQDFLANTGSGQPATLKIFLAPLCQKIPEFSSLDLSNAEFETRISQDLREFLKKNYSSHHPLKTTEFTSGLWNSRKFHGEVSFQALFNHLNNTPSLILETKIQGKKIIFNIVYWQKSDQEYKYEKIFEFNYRDFLTESIKTRVSEWKETRKKLLKLGKSRDDIKRLGGNCELNFIIFEELESLQSAGIDPKDLTVSYHFDRLDFEALCQFLSLCHCLVAGWVADIHYLVNEDIPPHLPVWLPPLGDTINDTQYQESIFQATVSLYQDVLSILSNDFPQEVPDLSLKLAESLMALPDPSLAIAQLEYSFACWRQQRQLLSPENPESWEKLRPSLNQRDGQYLASLKRCLSRLGDEGKPTQLWEWVNALSPQEGTKADSSFPSLPNFQRHCSASATVFAERVLSFTINDNGHRLIAQREPKRLKLWDLDIQTGQLSPQHELVGHSGQVLAVTLSRDGQLLASSDTTPQRSAIKLWDLETGRLSCTLFGHKQPIHALCIYQGDRSFLASGSHKIKLWDLHTGDSWLTLFGHQKPVYCLAISPDGKTLISGSQDNTLRIWNLKTGQLCRTLQGHQGAVKTAVLSPDGKILVSGSEDKTIKFWEVKTGKLLYTCSSHSGGVRTLTLNPYHPYLLSGCEAGILNLWDFETGNLLQTLNAHQQAIRAVAFNADGTSLASVCEAGRLQLWQACTSS